MSEPKTYASLSSGLLARKGGAKPAMRPQAVTNFGGNIEDLGWNDMGHQIEPFDHVPSSISALTPAPSGRPASEPIDRAPEPEEEFIAEAQSEADGPDLDGSEFHVPEAHVPEPHVQQRALEESFPATEPEYPVEPEAEPEAAPAPVAKAPRGDVVRLPKRRAIPAPTSAKSKAAFTLRLDPERHLRLRLACAVTRKSAQQLVTSALDEFLSTLPEVEELAGRVPAGQRSR
jgi:hypothetical protein